MLKVFQSKKPTNLERHIGVEIEFYSPFKIVTLARELKARKMSHYVTLKKDVSIATPTWSTYSYELAILGTSRNIFKKLKEVEDFLHKVKAKTNWSCGLHIHLDMRNQRPMVPFNNLVSTQFLLFRMNPKNRITNFYCKPNRSKKLHVDAESDPKKKNKGTRFFAINSNAYKTFKTLEVRLHTSTISSEKINNWIKILSKISNAPKIDRDIKNTDTFFKKINISDKKIKKYVRTQFRKHHENKKT